MKTAVFGGAFNPIHNGHKQIVLKCFELLKCDRLIVTPSKLSPHKSNDELIENCHRVKMCELALCEIKNCFVSDIETKREGLSYSVDTLSELNRLYPNDELLMICGSDMFFTLLNWKKPFDIFKLATICAFSRNNENIDKMLEYKDKYEKLGAKIIFLEADIPNFSSTQIRFDLKNGNFDDSMIDCKVIDYIKTNKLYI